MALYLHGLGHFHPENVISNRFLEELDIGTTQEWIMERVGIQERRTALSLDYIQATRNRDPRAALEASSHTNARIGAAAALIFSCAAAGQYSAWPARCSTSWPWMLSISSSLSSMPVP